MLRGRRAPPRARGRCACARALLGASARASRASGPRYGGSMRCERGWSSDSPSCSRYGASAGKYSAMCPSMSMTGWRERGGSRRRRACASNLRSLRRATAIDDRAWVADGVRPRDPQRHRGRRLGSRLVPRRRRRRRRPHRVRRPHQRAGRPRDRRRRPRRHARLHRRPHAHGRAGVLGRDRQQLVLARRDHGGDGQLRLHARAGAVGRAGAGRAQPRAGRGHRSGRARRRASTGASRPSPSTSTPSTASPKGINFAANVGHSALRTWAMGERAFEEEADDDDLARMAGQLERRDPRRRDRLHARRAAQHHETSDDRPVASRLASWDEVVGARRRDGRRSAPASSRAPTAACRRPIPTCAARRARSA